MNEHRISGAAMLAAILMSACGPSRTDAPVETMGPDGRGVSAAGTDAADRGNTMVRMVNAVPGAASVELTASGEVLFSAVGYKTVTDYVELDNNTPMLELKASGVDSTMAGNSELVMDGARYTILAARGEDGKVSLHVVRDEVEPDSGKASIRLINAVGDGTEADLLVAGRTDPLFDDVDFGDEAGPVDVDPMNADLSVRMGQRVKQLGATELEPGRHYTVVLVGRNAAAVEAVTFTDRVVETGN